MIPSIIDRLDYPALLALCAQLGNDVLIGFSGGVDALESADPAALENRLYNCDSADGGIGAKLDGNWIPGKIFLETVNEKSAQMHLSARLKPALKRPVRWSGTLTFDGMVDLCRQHGNGIMIGFTGGNCAFIRKSLDELQKRPSYKWDFASNKTGKKLCDWLPGATILELLKSYHDYG